MSDQLATAPEGTTDTTSPAIAAVIERIAPRLKGGPDIMRFAELMFAGADHQVVVGLSDQAAAALVNSAYDYQGQKIVLQHAVRVHSFGEYDSAEGRAVVEIVNDDMPFLVDSVLGEIRGLGHGVDLVLHPIMKVERSGDGRRQELLGAGDADWTDKRQESLIVVVIDAVSESQADELQRRLDRVLSDVRIIVNDWRSITDRFQEAVDRLEQNPPAIDGELLAESISFCRWLIDGQFIFFGIREYRLDGDTETGRLVSDADTGLGVLRDPDLHVLSTGGKELELTPESRRYVFTPDPLIITKSDIFSRTHRRAYMDYVGLKAYDSNGQQNGEIRVVGLFTSQAYTERPSQIPFLRRKEMTVMERSGFAPGSHDGKALISVLEHFPRDELFRIGNKMLVEWTRGILDLDLRPRVRVFARRDRFDRFVSALVYVPRERYSTGSRERIGQLLAEAFDGHVSAFNPFFPEGPSIRIHYIIGRNKSASRPEINEPVLEARVTELTRDWNDQLKVALAAESAEFAGLFQKYANAFSSGYTETFDVGRAIQDIARTERLGSDQPAAIDFQRAGEGGAQLRATIYRFDTPIPLSERVPVLENFGFRSIDERSYRIVPEFDDGTRQIALHDMVLEVEDGGEVDLAKEGKKLEDGFLAVRNDEADNDPFNRLIHAARLDWREVAVLRAYAAYLRQIGSPYGMRYVADTLVHYPRLTREIVKLFVSRFDPDNDKHVEYRLGVQSEIQSRVEDALADVPSLDEDRILRHYLNLIAATKRTNFYQRRADGGYPETISFKFAPREIDGVPEPRPFREIWVYSPRVEGVHLRFGPIARGGLRWSDRAQDFRTEVLGLCKAQQVKNTVIVPDGSKGGFLPKRLPRSGDRDAFMAEGVAAYKTFISSLIAITDNIVDGQIVPPERVVRYEDDDPYLVVAADKGTATFSDYANEISQQHGFWLGDAFASGGSAGYDHKKMGITARGGWESVKRHFREMDIDIQTTPFTAVGVGDMSGDVFGNGMLLSPATKLVAAFDHRDIFVDPNPDPGPSFAERQRLFDMGRSSWQDYDTSKLSAGGGIFSRSAKSIPVSEQMRSMLGIEDGETTPNALMKAILKSKA
ncbi:MAG: NAD-glutamate dehydrogenase domain-containing protein, partial [Hyphomicrobiaceae bacterium]